jgi:hypothetical protein
MLEVGIRNFSQKPSRFSRPLSSICGREYNIKTNLREMGSENVDLIQPVQDNIEWWDFFNADVNYLVTKRAENFLIS